VPRRAAERVFPPLVWWVCILRWCSFVWLHGLLGLLLPITGGIVWFVGFHTAAPSTGAYCAGYSWCGVEVQAYLPRQVQKKKIDALLLTNLFSPFFCPVGTLNHLRYQLLFILFLFMKNLLPKHFQARLQNIHCCLITFKVKPSYLSMPLFRTIKDLYKLQSNINLVSTLETFLSLLCKDSAVPDYA
jgi:hypothetical protein